MRILAEIYYQKSEFNKALAVADSSQLIAESVSNKRVYAANYSLLARIHKALDNIDAYNKYSALADSHREKNLKNKQIKPGGYNDNYAKYRQKQEAEIIDINTREKQFYKTVFFRVSVLATLLLLATIFFWMRNKKNKKEVVLLREKLEEYNKQVAAQPTKEYLHLKSKAVIDVDHIQFVKSDGHYLEFYLNGREKPEIDRNSLINVLEDLPSHQFIRIHKSFIVNIANIKIINSTKLMLESGKWINLSRTYKRDLKQVLGMV